MNKPVCQYSKEGSFIKEYESISEAARVFGVNESSIRKAATRNGTCCNFYWQENCCDNVIEVKAQDTVKKAPKILILDIETSVCIAMVYQKQVWKANIGPDKILSDWYILSWSAKWLGSKDIISERLTGKEALNENDKRIMRSLWDLLQEADVVIAHNGKKFDIPNINTRFIINGLMPTHEYKQIDTLEVVRKQFGFTHNSLNALAKVFGIEGKIETGFDLWKRCVFGDDEALAEMEVYNRHDVEMLEELYMKLRPYIKSHPNYSLYMDTDKFVCTHCGSEHIVPDGEYFTFTGKYNTYRCSDCGAISRERKSTLPKGKEILTSIPGR